MPTEKNDKPTETANVVTLTADMLKEIIAAALAASQAGQGSSGLEKALDNLTVMAKTQEHYAKTIEQQVRRSNSFHPNVSVYTYDPRCEFCNTRTKHPDVVVDGLVSEHGGLAHPKGELKHDTFFCYQKVRADELSIVELELFNSFESDKEARDGDWTATFRKNGGGRRELHFMVKGYDTHDIKVGMPSLVVILTELLLGQDAVDPTMVQHHMAAMAKRIAELEAKLAVA